MTTIEAVRELETLRGEIDDVDRSLAALIVFWRLVPLSKWAGAEVAGVGAA